jgi:TATA-box binding protein (TBP) (component of TFIID and TFIIIB)
MRNGNNRERKARFGFDMAKVSIVNVVATAALGQRVDLKELGKCPQIVYDPEIYGGRVAYFRSPKFTGEVTIFASGKMISVGGKSETEAFRALDRSIKMGFVKQVNLEKKTPNIVFVVDFGKAVDLEALAKDHRMVYEPEQFPGAILRMEKQSGVTPLFTRLGKLSSINQGRRYATLRLLGCSSVLKIVDRSGTVSFNHSP